MNLNLRQISSKLSTRGWIAVGASALIGVVFIYLVMTLASAPSYTTLVAGESPAQAQKVTTALATNGIQYRLSNSGTAVSVQSSQAGQARDLLDTDGLLVGGSSSSLTDLAGKQPLGASTFEQDEDYNSALEQQLDETIEQVNGISSATVLLNPSNQADTLFGGNTPVTASVLLTTTSTLEPSAVKGIAQNVANAVSGLNIDKVSITDQTGDLLWPTNGNGGSSGLTAKDSAEQAYDSQMAAKADAMLASTIGAGKAYVQVYADLNMNQQKVDSVTYGKTAGSLTSTTTKEKLTGDGVNGGTAGNNATKLASIAGTSTTGPEKYSNDTSTVTSATPKTVSEATIAPGEVNRQTVAVVVNSSVPATDDAGIESAVESTVGYKPRRDKVTLSSVPFAKVKPVAAKSSSKTGDIKYVAIGLGSLLFLLFLTRLLRKREADEFAGNPTWLRELEMPRTLSELEAQTQMVDLEPPTVVARLRSPVNLARQQVEELVDRDPERVAAQIRQWMTED